MWNRLSGWRHCLISRNRPRYSFARVYVREHYQRLSDQVWFAAKLSGSPAADGPEAFKKAGGGAVPAFYAPGPHGGRLQDGRKKPNQDAKYLLCMSAHMM